MDGPFSYFMWSGGGKGNLHLLGEVRGREKSQNEKTLACYESLLGQGEEMTEFENNFRRTEKPEQSMKPEKCSYVKGRIRVKGKHFQQKIGRVLKIIKEGGKCGRGSGGEKRNRGDF